MNGFLTTSPSRGWGDDVSKMISVTTLGVGAGLMTTELSPLLALACTLIFTTIIIILFVSSQRSATVIAESPMSTSVEGSSKLFNFFYLSFFLSITIPKAGRAVGSIPITVANICILVTLICWFPIYVFSKRLSTHLPLWKSVSLFILWGIASFLIGLASKNNYRSTILDFVAFIGFIPIYFLVCSVIRTSKQVNKIVWAVTISLIMICGYGVLQTRLGFQRVTIPGLTEQYDKMMYEGVGRWNVVEGGAQKVYSTFQNGNIFGNHLATFIPFLGGILIGLPPSRKKWIFSGAFLLACYVLILTYSRGALVGTVGGIIALAVISKKIRIKALLVVFVIFCVFLTVLWQYSDRPEFVRYDIRRIATNPDSFSAGRLERAKQVIGGFAELPFWNKLMGIGFGGVLVSPLGWRFEYMDNLYLTLLFKMGLVGMTILAGLLLHLFLTLMRLRTQTSNLYMKGLINGGIAGLFGSLVHNLADTLWFFPPLAANFWFLAGITMAIAMLATRTSSETP